MHGHTHYTWARTYASRPVLFLKPASVEELQTIVQNCRRNRQSITVVGAGHSPSTLTMSTSVLVNLDRMATVLGSAPGHGYTDVTVQSGMRLYQLNEYLAERGLALQNLGSISEQSVAGVISTGTHGSSAFHGLVSEQIVSLKLLTINGDVLECSDDKNPDIFKGALLSLGKFGIITEATIRCVPSFNLECTQQIVDFDEFLVDWWPTFFTSCEFHRIWWYPYSRKLIVWSANRTTADVKPLASSFYGTRLGRFLYEALLWLSVAIKPSFTPFVERWLFRNQFKPLETYVERSDRAINMDCLFSQFVDEWSLPLTNGQDCVRALDAAIAAEKYHVHAPIEIRVSNTSLPDKPLATRHGATVAGVSNVGPIYGNISRPYLDPSPKLPYAHPHETAYSNLTLNLNATMYRPFGFNSETRDWFSEFEEICEHNGGKPHWAKNFLGKSRSKATKHHMNGVAGQVEQWYSDDLQRWKALRRRLDPDEVFVGNKKWLHINGLIE